MGKISKLMKLLSASAVVAGANSVALADCGLCGEREHHYGNCPHFDYEGYGRKIGYYGNRMKKEDEALNDSDRIHLGWLAVGETDRTRVAKYLNISSSIVSLPTSSSGVVSSNNSWSNTETTTQSSNEKPSDLDKINTLKLERTQNLEDRNTTVSESDMEEMERQEAAIEIQNARQAQLADREETERAEAVQHLFGEDNMKALARERDTKELKDMMRERVAKDLRKSDRAASKSNVEDLSLQHRGSEEARDEAYDNRAKINNISKTKKLQIVGKNMSEAAKRRDSKRLQSMMKKSLAENREKERKDLESRREKLREKRDQKAAELRAEAEQTRIREERERTERFAEEQRRLEEEGARQAQIREEQERAEREEEEQLFAENRRKLEELEREYQLASETTDGGVADEEVEADRWNLPIKTSQAFAAAFSLHNENAAANEWAKQLEYLSIRKIECIFWLITTSYQQLQEVGNFAPTAQMADAISDVCNIFPYGGTNSGVLNVYNAFRNTDPSKFVEDLERLGRNRLDGVLYYVAFRYMQLLDEKANQKQAASSKFVELARATLEHFGINWNTENVKVIPDNKDVREAPRNPVNFKAADKGIVETEAPETTTWHPPYRVYYAYCENLKRDLLPSQRSMEIFQDKKNRAQWYQDELSKLSIRRLEAVIYFAAGAYECREVKHLSEVNKSIKGIRKVYQKAVENKQNAREQNVRNAIEHIVDKPNDNPVSMQPFYKGFTALTTNEQEHAFIDMAIAYREMLRNGKRPANMAFVNFADEVCKISESDGFVDGRDTKPLPEFSEFGDEAKQPQVSDTANSEESKVIPAYEETEPEENKSKDIPAFVPVNEETEPEEDSEWYIPKGLDEICRKYVLIDEEEGDRRDLLAAWGRKLRDLNIRRLEVVMYLAACQYGNRNKDENCTQGKVYELAGSMNDRLFSEGNRGNKRLENCHRALDNKQDAIVEFRNGYYQPDTHEGSFEGGFKRLKAREASIVLGEIAVAYREKLREGKRPSHIAFVEFADEVCNALNLDGWMSGEEYDEDAKHPVYEEFGNDRIDSSAQEEVEVRHGALGEDDRVLVDPLGA